MRRIEGVVASTRPVQLIGDTYRTRLTRSALQGMAEQMTQGCILINYEHLVFLPPIGRIYGADVIETEDGEAELHIAGAQLPTLAAEDGPSIFQNLADLPTSGVPEVSARLSYDRRNFDPKAASWVERDSQGLASPAERWSVLPLLIFSLSIPVVWAAKRFLGAFLDQLGKTAADELSAKIKSWVKKSKQPDRTVVFELVFECSETTSVSGFTFAGLDEIEATFDAAIGAAGDLATIAALQNEFGFLPGMERAAFFFDGERWQLGWWTDGASVTCTRWLEENPPDVAGVLGRPIPE